MNGNTDAEAIGLARARGRKFVLLTLMRVSPRQGHLESTQPIRDPMCRGKTNAQNLSYRRINTSKENRTCMNQSEIES